MLKRRLRGGEERRHVGLLGWAALTMPVVLLVRKAFSHRESVCSGACGISPLTGGIPRSPVTRICRPTTKKSQWYAEPFWRPNSGAWQRSDDTLWLRRAQRTGAEPRARARHAAQRAHAYMQGMPHSAHMHTCTAALAQKEESEDACSWSMETHVHKTCVHTHVCMELCVPCVWGLVACAWGLVACAWRLVARALVHGRAHGALTRRRRAR